MGSLTAVVALVTKVSLGIAYSMQLLAWGWRGQPGFHHESLDIAFVLYITNKHKGEKESASGENGVRGLMRRTTDTAYKNVLEHYFNLTYSMTCC